MSAPYLHLILVGQDVRVRGHPVYALGHQIPRDGHRDPDGIFVEWRWDGQRLNVRNDRYGYHPVFYFVRPGEICVSPSIPQLLARGAPTALDHTALAVFVRLGWFIGEDTPFRYIRALPPNALLEWEAGTLRLAGKLARPKPTSLSRDDAIDAFIALFKAAIRRRLPRGDDFAVPLSGGRDSRHILFALCDAGYRPRCCITVRHFPPRSNEDASVAALVAQSLGLGHVVLHQPTSQLNAELRKNLATSFCADEHAQFLPIADYLRGKVSVLYDGLAGGVLTGQAYLFAQRVEWYQSGRYPAFLVRESFEEVMSRLLVPEFLARANRDLALSRLTAAMEDHAGSANPIGSFFFWNTVRREVALAPYAILSDVGRVYSPYLDHDVYDLLASLPAGLLLDRQFHDDAIRRAYPRYAALPFAHEDRPQKNPFQHFQFPLAAAGFALLHGPSALVRRQSLGWRMMRILRMRALCLLQLERLTRSLEASADEKWLERLEDPPKVPSELFQA